jgi:DNA-binding MarR family transcriptional regulator
MKHDQSMSSLLSRRRDDSAIAGLRPLAGDLLGEPYGGPGSDAVDTLRATLLALVRRDGRDLTARQLTVFITVYRDTQVHTVGSMAELLNVSRPGVTRILDRLGKFGLVARQEDREDRRRVLIRRTDRGGRFLRELEDIAAHGPRHG